MEESLSVAFPTSQFCTLSVRTRRMTERASRSRESRKMPVIFKNLFRRVALPVKLGEYRHSRG
jgi:hypothetical protein